METIGPYRVIRRIGGGGTADVYLAYDPDQQREVAIKVLLSQFSESKDLRVRLMREAKVIAAIGDAPIVPILDYGELAGQPFVVMAYMTGGTLHERINGRPMHPAEISAILQRICRALEIAHQQGIVHRDLKPSNVLFDGDGQAYLSDFGIAKILQALQETRQHSLTGTAVIGTPDYMSPEQVMPKGAIDQRSDVYSLGIVLYEMLTGHVPYGGEHAIQVMMQHMNAPLPRLRKNEVPGLAKASAWNAILARALAKKPERRYATAGALVADVQRLVASQPPPPAPTVAVTRQPAAPTVVERPAKRTGDSGSRRIILRPTRQQMLSASIPLALGLLVIVPLAIGWISSGAGNLAPTFTPTVAPTRPPTQSAMTSTPRPATGTALPAAMPATNTPTATPSTTASRTLVPTATSTPTATSRRPNTPTTTATTTPTLLPTFTSTTSPDTSNPPSNQPPALTNPGDQIGMVGQPASLQVQASDPDGNALTFSASGLPAGLSIDPSTGLISGTPTTECTCQVTVTVSDGEGSGSTDFTWTIGSNINRQPIITHPGDQFSVVGQAVSLQIQASDPDGDDLAYSASGLPAGLGINDQSSGLITGTPTAECTCQVTVTVDDGEAASSTTFMWAIGPADNQPPVITSPGDQSSAVGQPVSVQVQASDPDGDTLTFSASGLPGGLSIDPSTGMISGTPTTECACQVTVTVSDGEADESIAFLWTVNPPARAALSILAAIGMPA